MNSDKLPAPVILIGIGEMAGVFARGLLRTGLSLIPATRSTDLPALAKQVPNPCLVFCAVGEADLPALLQEMPSPWHTRLGLLQNELLPRDWQQYSLPQPTVISVWFEKKPGREVKVLIPSPVFGPQASCLYDALASLHIPARVLTDENQLCFELVLKNIYILTTNLCGLEVGGNVAALWHHHRALCETVAREVMALQFHLSEHTWPEQALLDGFQAAIQGDPEHQCMGRSAPARLARALQQAKKAGLDTPELARIQQSLVQR